MVKTQNRRETSLAHTASDLNARLDTVMENERNNTTSEKSTYLSAYINDHSGECALYDCGNLTKTCTHCFSKNFETESSKGKTTYARCCHSGKVHLQPLKPYPEYLHNLISGTDSRCHTFMNKIRSYNSAMAFASMGASFVKTAGQGPYCFKIHGQIYHNTSSLFPDKNKSSKYAQLYILDVEEALKDRCLNNTTQNLDIDILRNIDNIIRSVNLYAQSFKMMKEVYDRERERIGNIGGNVPQVTMWITRNSITSNDYRRYDAPAVNEIAIVYRNTDGEPPAKRDICIHPKYGEIVRIHPLSPNVDPMTYPLLFPSGERGWNVDIPHSTGKRKVTLLQFYSYRLSVREGFNQILYGGKLTQQYIVDAYVKVEGSRLEYVKQNQRKLRVELYSGLMDYIHNDSRIKGVPPGRIVILPSTFQGGHRCMQDSYQNAMAVVRKYGKPDLFITVTCNPMWDEIKRNIEKYQHPHDRPDIVARVFHNKLQDIMYSIMKEHILGIPVAMVMVIEFQKRGLPHAHILLILRDDDKIRNSDDVDKIVCAEVPDPDKQPRLYNTVKSSMIHGPCGKFNGKSPCMESGVCSKGYPREYCNQSVINVEGYPSYRRRNNQRFIDIHRRDGSLKYRVNNQWIVPYNPYLLQKYNCHINVEVCSTIKSVKYLYKYIYKGHDCANIEISHKGDRAMNWDEVQMFLDSRYISAPEAIWRLFEFKMHDQSHSIITLAVHLPEGQSVYFIAGEEETAVERSARRNTTLTAYFQLNAKDEKARQYLYTEVPEHYVFSHGIWKERVRGAEKIISRMYTVSPMDIERYHLRLLLLHVRGARSFDELKLVEGISCDSFKEAARRRHLLKDDLEWERCLVEASTYQMPRQLRQLMAFICILCNPTNAQQLWMAHKCYMIEDFHRLHSEFESENLALADIENTLMTYGKRCVDFGLPQPIMRGKVYFLLDESTRVTDVTDI